MSNEYRVIEKCELPRMRLSLPKGEQWLVYFPEPFPVIELDAINMLGEKVQCDSKWVVKGKHLLVSCGHPAAERRLTMFMETLVKVMGHPASFLTELNALDETRL